ncbi:MAG: thiosulfate oxidation carrier protein SoxY [Burkholderiaceae bacterium]
MHNRREMLSHSTRVAAMLATLGLLPQLASAADASDWNKAAFDTKEMDALMKSLGVKSKPVESKDVTVTGPDIAENGAVVPVGASTTKAGVKRLLILVEKNPAMLAAMFDITDMMEPSVSTRVKMGQSSDVYAVALMEDGSALYAQKEIKVTLGGCGG